MHSSEAARDEAVKAQQASLEGLLSLHRNSLLLQARELRRLQARERELERIEELCVEQRVEIARLQGGL